MVLARSLIARSSSAAFAFPAPSARSLPRTSNGLVGQIEFELQRIGKSEVSSRVIGDMVITGLKEMDQIAYIRYAIVYLRLDDLGALRKEIDSLLKG